jgi:hypothetical protein
MDIVDSTTGHYNATRDVQALLWVVSDKINTSTLAHQVSSLGYDHLVSKESTSIIPLLLPQDVVSPVDPLFLKSLQDGLVTLPKESRGVFFESRIDHTSFVKHPLADRFTLVELLCKEMKALEDHLPEGKNLFYYLPTFHSRSGEWLRYLAHRAGKRTTLLFPAQVHKQVPHPVWNVFEDIPEKIVTPLMPVVNIGGSDVPKGLWPVLPYDLIDNFMVRSQRHHFAGAAIMTDFIPTVESPAGGHLWIAAHCLKTQESPWHALRRWGKQFHPEAGVEKYQDTFKLAREITTKILLKREQAASDGRNTAKSGDEISLLEQQELTLKMKKLELLARDLPGPWKEIILHFLSCAN